MLLASDPDREATDAVLFGVGTGDVPSSPGQCHVGPIEKVSVLEDDFLR